MLNAAQRTILACAPLAFSACVPLPVDAQVLRISNPPGITEQVNSLVDLRADGGVVEVAERATHFAKGFPHRRLHKLRILRASSEARADGIATYARASAGVSVDLSVISAQNTGASGWDTLLGIEEVVGSRFADHLKGNSFANTLVGGDGADVLGGGNGVDRLDGGDDADTLTGGLGADTLTGGAGSDTFVFTTLAEFGPNREGDCDHITDFDFDTANPDILDFSVVDANSKVNGDQAFKWLGTNAFTHSAGELRYFEDSGSTFVSGDVDGDGVGDFLLRLSGSHTLEAADFYL